MRFQTGSNDLLILLSDLAIAQEGFSSRVLQGEDHGYFSGEMP
jgi:hypothetical protein